MLCFGDEKIRALYVGGEKIKKAYVGGNLVFGSAGKPSRLPEGYQEVEYIANLPNASGEYAVTANMNVGNIKTNYVTMANRKYVLELMLKPSTEGSGNIVLFGSNKTCNYKGSIGGGATGTKTKGTASYYYLNPTATGISYNFCVDGLYNSAGCRISYPTDQKFSLTISTPKVTSSTGAVPIPVIVDGAEYTNTAKPYAYTTGIQSNWCLFGYQYYFSSTTSSSCTIGAGTNTPCKRPIYLYSFKVYDTSSGEDMLINDWVPCKDSSGNAGLIDLLSETFVANSDAVAPFTAGPEV